MNKIKAFLEKNPKKHLLLENDKKLIKEIRKKSKPAPKKIFEKLVKQAAKQVES